MQISKDTAFQKFSGSDLFGALQSGSVIFCIKFILHIFVFYGSFFNIFYMFIFTVYFVSFVHMFLFYVVAPRVGSVERQIMANGERLAASSKCLVA